MIQFIRLEENQTEIQRMSEMATAIVREHFDPLIGTAQNDYMIRLFQTPEAIASQLEKGYQYYFVQSEGTDIGFLAFYQRGQECYLSKFYLKKEARQKGYSHQMLDFVIEQAKGLNADSITLNVNRNNMAVWVYQRLGFGIAREEVNDIGQGFVMDDYVMQYVLRKESEMSEFQDKVVVVTGGAQGIGKCIAQEFKKQGAVVYVIDIQEGDHYVGDISKKEVLEAFADYVIKKNGHVDYLINNALPIMRGIDECSYEEFEYALAVGVTAPFYLTKLFRKVFAKGAAIVNLSSSRDRMSQPQTESYTAAKGGIASLTHGLAVSLAGRVRVNSISPGWIETGDMVYEGPDAYQQLSGRVGNPMDIANMALFLCSEKAGFITGENICIDGGMTKQMIYHGEYGWTLA